MKVTVFTPIHKLKEPELIQLRDSIEQADEWIVLLNGEALVPEIKDRIEQLIPTATIYTAAESGKIGALKAECCELAKGDILIEVDYDDYLLPEAIEKIKAAFEDESVQYVYSNSVDFIDGKFPETSIYSEYWGWRHRMFGEFKASVAFPPVAHYLRRIEFAPNHVRAFRKTAYEAVGGYDKTLIGGDDHELICKFYVAYGERGFKHVDEFLYMYRIHPDNSCNANNLNAEIQKQVDLNYIKYAEEMYKRWAYDSELLVLDFGGRFNCPTGYLSVDLQDADLLMDLNKPWRLEDNSVGVIRAYHVLEHLEDTIHFFNEAYRVLVDGGFLLIEVPSTNGELAWADPTHVSYFNPSSFEYYTNELKARYIRPQFKGRFQKLRLNEYSWGPNQKVVSTHLCALKGGWYDKRWCGEKLI